jgi:uncharacterized protein
LALSPVKGRRFDSGPRHFATARNPHARRLLEHDRRTLRRRLEGAVAAAPERGRANAALVALLAETLGVPPAAIRVAAGQTYRRKVVEIDGLDEEEAGRRLDAAARA